MSEEYEEELCRSKEENQRHRKLLDAVFQPEVRLHRADVQQLLVSKEKVPPEQQQWSPSLDQEDPPELPHIKEEPEELWTSQEGEQLPGLEEADATKFPFRVSSQDVQQLLVSKEEVPPEQQQWSPSLDQEDPPKPPHMKEEWSPRLDQEDPPKPPHIKEEWSPSLDQEDPPKPPHIKEEWSPSLDQEDPPKPPHMKEEWSPRLDQEDPPKPPHIKEEWSPSLDQEDPPEPPHIKAEQEEGEQHPGLEEADITKFPFVSVPVKSEDDEEHQHLKKEADGEDCGGPEPARNINPDSHLQPATHDQTSLSSKSETDNGCDWEETREPLQVFSKAFSCPVCKRRFSQKIHLIQHMRKHTGEKPFSCSVCGKRFAHKGNLAEHLCVHTGEKPFSCSVCGKTFARKGNLNDHLRVHTGEKPFSCSVCRKGFSQKATVRRHLKLHAGETI